MKQMLAMALLFAAMTAACTDPVAPAPPTPALPTITESFNGTLLVSSTNYHNFTVKQTGGVKVTLANVDPVATLGLGIGTPSTATGTCLVISSTTTPPGNTVQLSGTATIIGTFCVSVSDVGNLTGPVEYTVVVTHS